MVLIKSFTVLQVSLFVLIFIAVMTEATLGEVDDVEQLKLTVATLNRSSFPNGFVFGAGSAAYQNEGAANEGGRKASIWDVYTHNFSGTTYAQIPANTAERISDGSNGDIASDFYHRYEEDIKLMKDMGSDAFRFSISWSRILPGGKLSKGVNQIGIDFYDNLIDEILANGLQPFATIFHWDLPQALEKEYGGFLSPRIVDDFTDFAELCYMHFGDRVKHWITINEPWSYSVNGYDLGTNAPGRCSQWVAKYCLAGNSATEPYIVAHHLILAHGAAVQVYRQKYQAAQKGSIGISHVVHWMVPYSDTEADKKAAERELDFMYGWFMEPITYGTYPSIMKQLVGRRLSNFTKEESEMLKGSYDFVGVNYYTAYYAVDVPYAATTNVSYETDVLVDLVVEKDGKLIGPQAASSWLHVYPKGMHNILIYTKQKFNNPAIYITENGYDEFSNISLPLSEALKDPLRILYHYKHLAHLLEAIREGVDVKGYFAWAATDNFQWSSGYTKRFGLVFVDFRDNLKRYPKDSYYWLQKFLQK